IPLIGKEAILCASQQPTKQVRGQPMHERQYRVELYREPAIWRSQEGCSTCDTRQLADKAALLLSIANMLENRTRMHDVKAGVAEGQCSTISTQEPNAGISLLQKRRIIDACGSYLILMRIPQLQVVRGRISFIRGNSHVQECLVRS